MRVFVGYDVSVCPDYFGGDHPPVCEHRLIFSNHVVDATRLTIILDATTMAERECTLGELRAWLAERARLADTHDASAQEPRIYTTEVPDIPSAPDAPEGQELI